MMNTGIILKEFIKLETNMIELFKVQSTFILIIIKIFLKIVKQSFFFYKIKQAFKLIILRKRKIWFLIDIF